MIRSLWLFHSLAVSYQPAANTSYKNTSEFWVCCRGKYACFFHLLRIIQPSNQKVCIELPYSVRRVKQEKKSFIKGRLKNHQKNTRHFKFKVSGETARGRQQKKIYIYLNKKKVVIIHSKIFSFYTPCVII